MMMIHLTNQIQDRFRYCKILIVYMLTVVALIKIWLVVLSYKNRMFDLIACFVTIFCCFILIYWHRRQLEIERIHREVDRERDSERANRSLYQQILFLRSRFAPLNHVLALGLTEHAISKLPSHVYNSPNKPKVATTATTSGKNTKVYSACPSSAPPSRSPSPSVSLSSSPSSSPSQLRPQQSLSPSTSPTPKPSPPRSPSPYAPLPNSIGPLVSHNEQPDLEDLFGNCEIIEEPYHDITCCICLTDYSDGDVLTTLPCSHIFHCKCISEWLLLRKLCPMCKREVVVD